MAVHLTETDVSKIKDFFLLVSGNDVEEPLSISTGILSQALHFADVHLAAEDVKELLLELDPDENGTMHFTDLENLSSHLEEPEKPGSENEETQEVLDAFRVLDKDCSGCIPTDVLRDVMANVECVTREEIDDIIAEADNGDGQIHYDDFVKTMTERSLGSSLSLNQEQ